MTDFATWIYDIVGLIPLECLEADFMRRALLALLLLAPMASVLGVHMLHQRMAFFSDAVGHSAFAGVALGLILGVSPRLSMPLFGVLTGLGIMALSRRSTLGADTATGVVFSAVVAFGLAVTSAKAGLGRDMQQFLYGDVLTITGPETAFLGVLSLTILAFQTIGYNRMLQISLSPVVARAWGMRVALWQYVFALLLSVVVMFSVWAVGVLLVTALLIVPAATARNLARSAGGMFWWSMAVGTSSAFIGLVLSAQEWCSMATGATIILVASGWFGASMLWKRTLGR
ncbi:MAG: metal ABC transporter permease [Desulfovibrio sp.]|nr:metal ABC transporter permease [Desulfovibrio sp.]